MSPSLGLLEVGIEFSEAILPVGKLASREGRIYFEYDSSFLDRGLDISPFSLPLRPGVQSFDRHVFEGLPGVFHDSLPDGWGRLLFDRMEESKEIPSKALGPLARLAYAGRSGMGALIYESDVAGAVPDQEIDLDEIAVQVRGVLGGEAGGALRELLILNGSSAGARPKAMIGLDAGCRTAVYGRHPLREGFDPWMVKFPGPGDGPDAGAVEFVYARMAKEAGLHLSEAQLLPGQASAGYFATRRFDRKEGRRLHLHSACGLLHSDFRVPALDYRDLVALTMALTRDVREAEEMFRLAVFNVLAHNRDDHSKNFSFLMDAQGSWTLSPAYDLTFASGPGGEQSTTVMGEGKNPGIEHLVRLGMEAELSRSRIDGTIERVKASLSQWRKLAEEHGIVRERIDLIGKQLESHLRAL